MTSAGGWLHDAARLLWSVFGLLALVAAVHFTFSKDRAGWWLRWWKLRNLWGGVGAAAVAVGFVASHVPGS